MAYKLLSIGGTNYCGIYSDIIYFLFGSRSCKMKSFSCDGSEEATSVYF